jgi:hypothetical protein
LGTRALADVQRFVTSAVRGAVAIGEDDALAREAASLLVPGPRGMAPHDRLEVYREQFWIRHLASIAEDFPTLTWVLGGPAAFRELATAYLLACPPVTWDLQRLGAGLPAFVQGHSTLGHDALARDAVRLDWAFMEAFDAPDSPPFDARLLASTPEDAWPNARIDFDASLRTLVLHHATHELRAAVQTGSDPRRPAPAKTCVVVYRDATCFLHAVAIDALAFDLVARLQTDAPLGEACEAVARESGRDVAEIGTELGGWFQQWTASGWIRAVRF